MDGRCAPRVQTCRKVTAPFARYFHLATETDPNPIDPLQGSFGIKFFNLLDAICLNTAYGGFSLTFCSRVSQIISFSSLILCSSDLAFRALLFQNGRLLPRPRLLDSGKHIASISLSLHFSLHSSLRSKPHPNRLLFYCERACGDIFRARQP